MEITGSKIAEWLGLLAVIGGLFATLGSYWINTEVERRMNELAVDPAAAPVVVELKTEMENVESAVERVEDKVDAFSEQFLSYLEREASR